MKKNMGQIDRYIRIVLGIGFIIAGIFTVSTILWLSIVFFVLALVMAVSSTTRVCPLYIPFHISTIKSKED